MGMSLRALVEGWLVAEDLQARAVDDQTQRLTGALLRQHHVQILRAPTQRRVVRHWQVGEGELAKAAGKSLHGAQR